MKKLLLFITFGLVSLSAVESETLYKECVVCHGKHAELMAIQRSPILASLSEEDLSLRLKNILDGSTSLSKSYLGMHKAKLHMLKDEETDAFAKYIIDLKN
ncbi:MAG: hypothetical protein PHU40_10920 [Sulfurimonas sp.]|nr:hypothetical protein [Sulfurimonas sp.]